MKRNFTGISLNKNGKWDVHYQYHYPKLRIQIKSRPDKFFLIKEKDDGELSIQYYDTILKLGKKDYVYANVIKELFPYFNGNEIEALKFIEENQDKLNNLIKDSIYSYCIKHNKEKKEFNIIEANRELLYCELSDINDIKIPVSKYCELVHYSIDDLLCALKNYYQSIGSSESYVQINPTARERSIVRHYPGEKY